MRMNFPTRHPLYGGGSIAQADVILGLEVPDFFLVTHTQTPINRMGMETKPITKPGAKLIIFGAAKREDGSLEANRVNVGRDGVTPPM